MPKASAYVPYEGPVVTRAEAKAGGERLFYTGKACRRGHFAQRYVAQGLCAECAKASAQRQRDDDPLGCIAKVDAWRKANKDKVNAYAKAWAEANPDARKAYEKAYRIANKDKLSEVALAWRNANRDRFDENAKAWYKANKPRVRAIGRNRRARVRSAEGTHTGDQILDLLRKQGSKCAECRKSLKSGYHADHIMPLKRGGSNDIGNIQLLCETCNLSKGYRDPIEWARKKGRLL
jgi:5-methylcytosine-specific restriction endonuclease McrA